MVIVIVVVVFDNTLIFVSQYKLLMDESLQIIVSRVHHDIKSLKRLCPFVPTPYCERRCQIMSQIVHTQ